jgi:hypothetical protein
MVRRSVDPETLEAEIARLPDLGLAELRARWTSLYGVPAPKFLRRKLLIRGIAYQMQVKLYGGLPEQTKRQLRAIAQAAREGSFNTALAEPRIKPGTKLIRTWKHGTHEVLVLADGFAWKGTRYRSLSTIAKTITGTSWNGWTFFGIKRSPPRDDRDVLGRFRRATPARDANNVWPRSRNAFSIREAGEGSGNA